MNGIPLEFIHLIWKYKRFQSRKTTACNSRCVAKRKYKMWQHHQFTPNNNKKIKINRKKILIKLLMQLSLKFEQTWTQNGIICENFVILWNILYLFKLFFSHQQNETNRTYIVILRNPMSFTTQQTGMWMKERKECVKDERAVSARFWSPPNL